MTAVRRIAPRMIGIIILAGALVAGCSRADGSPPPAPATVASDGGLRGAHVHVLGLWSGPELDSFVAVKSIWERETGALVDWEPSTDLAGALSDHVSAGDPPEI